MTAASDSLTRRESGDKAEPVDTGIPPANDDSGLSRLMTLLDEAGVRYWIDSGVLLGLIREGGLMAWEKDIDLAAMDTELKALLGTREAFERAGYRFSVNRYRGVVYSVSITPENGLAADNLRASVHVYYEVGGYLWSPQTQLFVPPPAPDVYTKERSWGGRLLQWVIERRLYAGPAGDNAPGGEESRVSRAPDRESLVRRGVRWLYHRFDRGFMAESWPVREVYVPLTWVIPRDLILPLSERTIADRQYPAPHRPEDYLAYRYGDWRTPVRNWCYWTDDGAIRRENPLKVRDRLVAEHRD